MPVGCINPNRYAINKQTNSKMEKPTRSAKACTVRLLLPLSRIRKTRAEARLPMISKNAMATIIFIVSENPSANSTPTGKND